MVAETPSDSFKARPVSIETPYAGMVGWFGVPSVAMPIGSPATLFATSTATAPASWALRIFTEKAHAPRVTSAILPVRLPAGKAAQAVFRPFTPAPVGTPRGAVRSLVTTAKSPLEAPYTWPPTVTGAPIKWFTELAPAVNARAA